MQDWFYSNKLSLNGKKTKYILFSGNNKHVHTYPIYFGGTQVERIGSYCDTKAFKFLGYWVDDTLSWDIHINKLILKLNGANYALAKMKNKLPFLARKAIYYCLVQSHLTWGSAVTGATGVSNINKLESLQNKIIRNLCNKPYNSHTLPLYYEHSLLKFSDLISYNQTLFGYKFRKDLLTISFYYLFKYSSEQGGRDLRDNLFKFHVPVNGGYKGRSPFIEIIQAWNRLSYEDKTIFTIPLFKKQIKSQLLEKYDGFECSKPKCYSCNR